MLNDMSLTFTLFKKKSTRGVKEGNERAMFVVFISSLSVHYERPTIRIEQKKKKKDSKPPQNESSNYGTTP